MAQQGTGVAQAIVGPAIARLPASAAAAPAAAIIAALLRARVSTARHDERCCARALERQFHEDRCGPGSPVGLIGVRRRGVVDASRLAILGEDDDAYYVGTTTAAEEGRVQVRVTKDGTYVERA